jgi:hypothetical protein
MRLFNLSQMKKPPPHSALVTRSITAADSSERPATILGACALCPLQQRMAVVSTTDVGNQTPSGKPDQPIVERLAGSDGRSEVRIDKSNPLKAERPRICGAMSQQRGDSGNVSAPQKFVRLVGCRDSKARPEPWVRPRPAPMKR